MCDDCDDEDDKSTRDDSLETRGPPARREGLQLVIVWYYSDPRRVGEVFEVPSGERIVIGRDPTAARPVQRRPGGDDRRCPGLDDPHLSRRHLYVEPHGSQYLTVWRGGRSAVLVNDEPLAPDEPRQLFPGALVQLGKRLLLLVAPAERPEASGVPLHLFGMPDEHGIVGETAASWTLRYLVHTLGPGRPHVLVHGESGVGKELVARAIRRVSERSTAAFVDRNAATFTDGLMDAELVGNVKGYPGESMPERKGLIRSANGGILFLDEIGDLPEALQPKLLRVMDDGSYQRLGDPTTHYADIRVIGATNRPIESLRPDLAARFTLRIEIPPLRDRIADVPLIVRHLATQLEADNAHFASDLLDENRQPRIRCRWIAWLLRQRLATNVREVRQAFWHALQTRRPGEPIDLPRSPVEPPEAPLAPGEGAFRDPDAIPCEEVAAAMATGRPVREIAEMLGLRNRDQLYRLRRRCNLV